MDNNNWKPAWERIERGSWRKNSRSVVLHSLRSPKNTLHLHTSTLKRGNLNDDMKNDNSIDDKSPFDHYFPPHGMKNLIELNHELEAETRTT